MKINKRLSTFLTLLSFVLVALTGCRADIDNAVIPTVNNENSSAMDRYIARVHEQINESAIQSSDGLQFATISFERYLTEAELTDFVKSYSLDIRSASWNVAGAGGPSSLIGESVEEKILHLRRYVEDRFSQSKYDDNYLKQLQTEGVTFGVVTVAGVSAREARDLWSKVPFIRLIELHPEANSLGGGIAPETR